MSINKEKTTDAVLEAWKNSDLTLGRFVVEFHIIVALPGSKNKITPSADKINQSGTSINTTFISALVVQVFLFVYLKRIYSIQFLSINNLLSMSKSHQIDSLLFMSNFDGPVYFSDHNAYCIQ